MNPTATVPQEERPAGFLTLMRSRNYALLWWGQFVSEMGNRFHWIAVSLWIYSVTQSASAVSLAISSMFVGSLAISLWAGVLVDRLNRKVILIASDVVRALLVALIPRLMEVNMGLVYADLGLISVATAFFRPAIFAIVPTIVVRRDLLPANSFFTAMDTGTEIIGPAIAGILALQIGYAPLLYIDAATYLISALCIVAMLIPIGTKLVERLDPRTVWKDVIEGFRYVRSDALQWSFFVLLFPTAIVGSGLNSLQTPLAKGALGITDAQFGTFNSTWGIGFVAASLLLGWYGVRLRRSAVILSGFFGVFFATALMGLSRSFGDLLITAFVVGFANTLHYVGLSTFIMEYTPQHVIGRLISIRQVALGSIRVLSPLAFGTLADYVGVRPAILLMALVGTLGTTAVIIGKPVIVKFDAPSSAGKRRELGIFAAFSGSVDPSYAETEQRKLNMIALISIALGWLGLLYWVPLHALGLVIVAVALGRFGMSMKRKGWFR